MIRRVKPEYIYQLFKKIKRTLNVDADLIVPNWREYPEPIEKRLREFSKENVYALASNIAGINLVFLNYDRTIEDFNKYKFLPIHSPYVPTSLKLSFAVILIHELTHCEISSKKDKNKRPASLKIVTDIFEKYGLDISEIIPVNLNYSAEDLLELHDNDFQQRYFKNLFKCSRIILKLENEKYTHSN